MRHLPSCVIMLFVCFVITKQQNSTNPRRGQHRDSNLMSAVQLMQVQLTTLETEAQRQSSRTQEVIRATTRLESQRQELIASMDRSESRLMQRIDDVKGESRKIITLQDIIREDIDKMQQNQLLTKVWLEEQIRQMANNLATPKQDSFPDPALTPQSSTDILANLQILQSTLYSLRRMADTLQSSISMLKTNITDLTNITRSMLKYEQEALVTKSYFQSALQMFMDEKSELHISWLNPTSTQELEETLPKDCFEVQQQIQNKSGIYRIRLKYSTKPIFVNCDMETEGGGWTVFQRRLDGSTDFLREWQDYKHGFGNVGGEFWWGNENLYLFTHQDLYELRVDLSDFEGNTAFSKYGAFAVGSEKEKYMLKLLGPITGGDAGDGMTYHASMPFSTIDADHDRWPSGHCAVDHSGGWWYNQCDASNLNGKYLRGLNPYEYQGVYWHEWQGPSYSLQSTKMMLRPTKKQFVPARNYTEVIVAVAEDVEQVDAGEEDNEHVNTSEEDHLFHQGQTPDSEEDLDVNW